MRAEVEQADDKTEGDQPVTHKHGRDVVLEQNARVQDRRFAPDLLLVSAGYDAHWRDPLAGLQMTTAGYQQLAARLAEVAHDSCSGRVGLVLEGGYDLEALGSGVVASLYGLMGIAQPAPDPLGPAPRREPDVSGQLARVRRIQRLED